VKIDAMNVAGRAIAAVYSGDVNFNGSTSAVLPVAVSAAGNPGGTLAGDEIANVFGVQGLSGDTAGVLPMGTSLGGVTVKVVDSTGTASPALLYGVFSSAGQVNLVIPADAAAGLATLVVTLPGGGSATTVIDIAGSAPGVFTANMTGQGTYAGQVIYGHADGSETIANSTTPVHLDVAGDQVYLVLYGTGLRHAHSVTATVNGTSVPVVFSGAQGSYPGMDQINLGPLPASLAGAGSVNLVITADGQVANTVTVSVQ
jgi:uncharacterized protein (TIGR03437 family)